MNDYVISVLLGIVEGLTEFLPVSSTAHLRIAEALMHINLTDPYWKMYSVVIQLGAILALTFLFLTRIIGFFRTFPDGETGNRNVWNHPITLTAVAFVVTAVPSLLLIKVIGKHLESLLVMAWSLVLGGIIMWVVDVASEHRPSATQQVEEMTLPQAIWIGFCQIFSAVFPGTSRSMSTIAGGQVAGLSRMAALEFSFLLSIPTMFAATFYDLFRAIHPKHGPGSDAIAPLSMTAHGWVVLAIGFAVSLIVALGVVEWFLLWVRRHGFVPFAIYRIVAGALLFAWVYHWIR